MADANQLKIEARREEAAGDYEQASRLYLEALSAMDEGGNLSDPSLLVRVADLEYRQDDRESALEYYLQAVDEYAEQGLITNAIAVCNKILRVFPDQVDCHRRLADLHMDVGLTAEARQNLLRFADEAWNPDDPGPVLEAMGSFLDRTPDQEVALQLATRMADVGREDDALEALEAVWEERTQAGADVDALERKAREIRPGADADAWTLDEAPSEEDEETGADGEAADDAAGEAAGSDAGDEPWLHHPEPQTATEEPDEERADETEGAADGPAADPDEAGGGEQDPEETDGGEEDAEWAIGVDVGSGGRSRDESSDEAREDAAAGRSGSENGREPWSESPPDLQGLPEPALGAGGRPTPGPVRELELMASFRDRLTRFRRPSSPGGTTATGAEQGGAAEAGAEHAGPGSVDEPASPAGEPEAAGSGTEADARQRPRAAEEGFRGGGGDVDAMDMDDDVREGGVADVREGGVAAQPGPPDGGREVGADAPPAGADGRGRETETTDRKRQLADERSEPAEERPEPAEERSEPADERHEPAEERPQPAADADSETARRKDEIMEELNELDRANEISTADPDGWENDLPADGGEDAPSRPDGTAGTPGGEVPPSASDEKLGEEAELRRGMSLVDEMLEVQPENLDLRERKLRYARRLGDRDALVEASLDLADALAKKEARRSARALYRRVLELDPENQAAESGLARLDVGELEEKRQAGKRAGAAHATPKAASPEEQEARRELGMRLWTEFENSIREMPWLHAATQAYQATGPDALPPIETFEMLAHYLMARERHRDAAEILERALELTEQGDEKVTDVLYYLGRAYESLGERDRAAEYFDRLEKVDPDFARVRETLPDTGGS